VKESDSSMMPNAFRAKQKKTAIALSSSSRPTCVLTSKNSKTSHGNCENRFNLEKQITQEKKSPVQSFQHQKTVNVEVLDKIDIFGVKHKDETPDDQAALQ